MDAGDIAEALFEISIGILCIVLSFFRKNDQSEDAKFIRKYNKQLLLVFGMLSLIRGTQVFIDERRSPQSLMLSSIAIGIIAASYILRFYLVRNTPSLRSKVIEAEDREQALKIIIGGLWWWLITLICAITAVISSH